MKKIVMVLKTELASKARQIGKPFSWFQFAKKTKYGYRFLANKGVQWNLLQDIVGRIGKKYPQYTTGEIVDLLGDIVNSPDQSKILQKKA